MNALIAAVLFALPSAKPPTTKAPPAVQASWDLEWMIGPREDAPRRPPPRPTARSRALGQSLYLARCVRCHGDAGDGRGPLAAGLRPPATDFTRGVFKLRSTPTGTLPTDADLFITLGRGMHGTPMLPWRALTEPERWALVDHVKSFSPRFRNEPAGKPFRVPPPPRETDALRDEGERLYVLHRCGACHGDTGAGDGPARERYRQEGRRDVRIRDFTRGRFLRGSEPQDLFLTLRAGVEGTPMGAYDALPDDQIWALAAYVRLLVRERPLHELPPAGTDAGPVK
jgi:cytochrome c oxidase cbb3-type subunit 2